MTRTMKWACVLLLIWNVFLSAMLVMAYFDVGQQMASATSRVDKRLTDVTVGLYDVSARVDSVERVAHRVDEALLDVDGTLRDIDSTLFDISLTLKYRR